ncbi:MAG: hypothetical protein K2Q22_16330, partial [Cytophagales bacterium]|nr:hypothetical protein [Cytophagales bacterium]
SICFPGSPCNMSSAAHGLMARQNTKIQAQYVFRMVMNRTNWSNKILTPSEKLKNSTNRRFLLSKKRIF